MTREEAIKVIKAWDFLDKDEKEAIETLIPELVESEDERISREITKFILSHRIDEPNDLENINSWLAWLEKQGKSKWTEEDELMLLSTIQSVEMTNGAAQIKVDWLKSLKKRIKQ